jgi:hypothetical protein
MSDVAFIVLTIVVFALLAMSVRGVERLVGQAPERGGTELPGGGNGTPHTTERPDDDGSPAISSGGASVGARPDRQVAR